MTNLLIKIISLPLLIVSLVLNAQGPDKLWTKTFGGGYFEKGNSVQQTRDGGYIVAGDYLIKTDSNGKKLWKRKFGGNSVQQTKDGGYIVAGAKSVGTYRNKNQNFDVLLTKTDSNGDTLWTKTFGGSEDDWGQSVQQTSEGGYIIAGWTNSYGAGENDIWLIKTDYNGDTLWTKTYGGVVDDVGWSVRQTTDGGYIIAGYTKSYGSGDYDVWLIKTDCNGNSLWAKTYGGSDTDESSSIQQTDDGGYIVAGYTRSYGAGNGDVYLIKTDDSGDTVWTRAFGGVNDDAGTSVQQTMDGGYIVTGRTSSYGAGDYDIWLIKVDSNGDVSWKKTFGGNSYDRGKSVRQTSDGGYIIVGFTDSYAEEHTDVWLIKTTMDNDLAKKLLKTAKENESEGEYDKAIKIYSKIISKCSSNEISKLAKERNTELKNKIKKQKIENFRNLYNEVSAKKVRAALVKLELNKSTSEKLANKIETLDRSIVTEIIIELLDVPLTDFSAFREYREMSLHQKLFIILHGAEKGTKKKMIEDWLEITSATATKLASIRSNALLK